MIRVVTRILSIVVTATLAAAIVVSAGAQSQQDPVTQTANTLERGYRVGYTDGYQAGVSDLANRATRDYQNKREYIRADRAYQTSHGTVEDYRDGYQQGFEIGYSDGYDRQPFRSDAPPNLKRRGTIAASAQSSVSRPEIKPPTPPSSGQLVIPRETILRIELQNSLTSDASKVGDIFEARVVDPIEFDGAMVFGRVARVDRPGKVKGTAELQLEFEQIRLIDGRSAKFSAIVIEVVAAKNAGVGGVDSEGGIHGRNDRKSDAAKIGAASAIGAAIGAIFGGGKGAAVGAVIGGSAGAGRVMTSRGNDIQLPMGQELRIRTSSETRVEE